MNASTETDDAQGGAPRNWLRILSWTAGPALVLGIGGWLYLGSGRYASTDNAYVQADRVTIAAQIGGRVVEVDVRENQAVKRGDLLFELQLLERGEAAELHVEDVAGLDLRQAQLVWEARKPSATPGADPRPEPAQGQAALSGRLASAGSPG